MKRTRATIRRVASTDNGLGDLTMTVTNRSWSAMVAPRFGAESTDPRVPPVVIGKTLYGEATVAIHAGDRVLLDGVEWEVDGEPAEWPWPTGGKAGLEVQLVRAS